MIETVFWECYICGSEWVGLNNEDLCPACKSDDIWWHKVDHKANLKAKIKAAKKKRNNLTKK